MATVNFKFLEHTADIKFVAYGASLEKVFRSCALALAHYVTGGKKVAEKKRKKILIRRDNPEALLYNFLDELLYLLDAEGFVVSDVDVSIKGDALEAIVLGDDSKHYNHLSHIKAATYAEMYIKKKKTGWEAQVVLDV